MIEAPCAACGTVNRIVEADVPAGAKFVTCSSCKSRVPLPTPKTVAGVGAVPKIPAIPAPPIPKTPPPTPSSKAAAVDLADLPAPKRTSALGAETSSKPAPKSALDVADLPAPKAKSSILDDLELAPAATKSTARGVSDLPAPKAKPIPPRPMTPPKGAPIVDLPAPKGIVDLPAPKPGAGITDLPAPKTAVGVPPASKSTAAPGIVDLPMPKGIVDLPAPKGIVDLPAPKQGGVVDLPAPKASVDLPAPKGFFDDLPQPARAKPDKPDLPAPKGFFDDLPQPALQSNKPELPAPKGFFDDLPQPAKPQKPELPAPKGFFDDLPQPALPNTPAPPAPMVGVFDDIPVPMSAEEAAAPRTDLDLDLPPPSASDDLDLSPDVGALDLDPGPAGGSYGDLDLQQPTPPPTGIKISTPKTAGKPLGMPISPAVVPAKSQAAAQKGDLKLELEGETNRAPAPAAIAEKKPGTKKKSKKKAAEEAARKRKRTRRMLGTLLAVAALGGGGFYFYQRHVKQQESEAAIAAGLADARRALFASTPNHWQQASGAARAVLDLDAKNPAALGIGAEAAIAGALDNGVSYDARIASGRKLIQDALEAGVTGPELDRAQAVASVASNQPDVAIPKLTGLSQRAPKDGFLLLYLGWAQLEKGDATSALKSFDAASTADPNVKLPALYGRGRAKLMLADVQGARADFAAVTELDKKHIGAQVGLAATLPPSQSLQRESDLQAVLRRDDIATADKRAVVQALTMLGDVARQGGRLDVARDRYAKALEKSPLDVAALTGAATVEIRDGKLAAAKDLLAKATAQAKDDPIVLLATCDLLIHQGKLVDALAITKALDSRQPPLPPLLQAQLYVVKGKLLEAQGEDDAAVDAYEAGAKIAGELDLTPTMAAVEKLSALAKKMTEAKDDAKAAAYRDHADKLLSALAERAQEDAQLSMTLGVAYLQEGDPTKAEALLRRAGEMRPQDIEPKVELAHALVRLNRADEAIVQLKDALAIDKTRADIQLELARAYEAAKKDDEAGKAYDALVAAKDASIAARVHAGKFYARTGQYEKAAEQAQPILFTEPDNPAGHYLKGEGYLKAGKLDEARREFQIATDADPDPQYLDAYGRAAEASAISSGDTKYYELAIHEYEAAAAADPSMFNPLAGQGRVHIARNEYAKADAPLQAAFKVNPKDPAVMYMLGQIAKNLNQDRVAVEWLKKSVAIRPDGDAYYLLGQAYFEVNNPAACQAAYARAVELGSEQAKKTGKPPTWLVDAYYWAGRIAIDPLKNEPLAAKYWRVYVTLNPPENEHTNEVRNSLLTTLKND